jgi:hypothetical protein
MLITSTSLSPMSPPPIGKLLMLAAFLDRLGRPEKG